MIVVDVGLFGLPLLVLNSLLLYHKLLLLLHKFAKSRASSNAVYSIHILTAYSCSWDEKNRC
jgi:hypothetical protein